jgi:hypothetical protein
MDGRVLRVAANDGPMHGLWIEVPATSSAEDLARVVDEFPPGDEGRYYLIHMDLMAGRVDFGDALTRRGYQVTVSEEILRRYTFGTQQEHFAVFWLGDDQAPGETANPAVHLIADDRGLAPDRLRTEPAYSEVSLEEYHQWQHQGEPS